MNKKNILLLVVPILLILAAGLLFYLRPFTPEPGRIEGFYGFEWGTELTEETEARLVEKFGTPHITYSGTEEIVEGNLEIRGFMVKKFYDQDLEVETANASFSFHNKQGLIGGNLSLRINENETSATITGLKQTLRNQYPKLEEIEPGENLEDVIIYNDPLSNSTIVINHKSPGRVDIVYISPLLSTENHQAA